jgi:hypothetical protein
MTVKTITTAAAVVLMAATLSLPAAGSARTVLRIGDVGDSLGMASGAKRVTVTSNDRRVRVDFRATQVYRPEVTTVDPDTGETRTSFGEYGPPITREIEGRGTIEIGCGAWRETIIGPWFVERVTSKRRVLSNRVTTFKMPAFRPGEICSISLSLSAGEYFGGEIQTTKVTGTAALIR